MSLPGALQGFPKPAGSFPEPPRASGGFRKLELPGRFLRRVGSLSEPGSFDIGRPRARTPKFKSRELCRASHAQNLEPKKLRACLG